METYPGYQQGPPAGAYGGVPAGACPPPGGAYGAVPAGACPPPGGAYGAVPAGGFPPPGGAVPAGGYPPPAGNCSLPAGAVPGYHPSYQEGYGPVTVQPENTVILVKDPHYAEDRRDSFSEDAACCCAACVACCFCLECLSG